MPQVDWYVNQAGADKFGAGLSPSTSINDESLIIARFAYLRALRVREADIFSVPFNSSLRPDWWFKHARKFLHDCAGCAPLKCWEADC